MPVALLAGWTFVGTEMTDRSMDEILSKLRRLSRLPDDRLPAHFRLKAIADDLVRTSEFRQLQREKLEIYVAGFLYLDEANSRVDYQFFGETEGEDASEYTLAYSWKEGQRLNPFGTVGIDTDADKHASAFIDSIFYSMRGDQSPWATAERTGKQLPEYLAWLPQRSIASAVESTGNCETSQSSTNALRERYGWHYCPYGEVAFFLYMWRLLLWASICFGRPSTIAWRQILGGSDFGEQIDFITSQRGISLIWAASHWVGRSDGYEKILYESTFTKKSEFAHREWVKQGLEYFDGVHSAATSRWTWELRNLLLTCDDGESTPALGPALRFAHAVLLAYDRSGPSELISLSNELRQAGILDHGWKFNGSGTDHCDRYLRLAALAWLSSCLDDKTFDTWDDAIAELHRRSRFPIIPYFYWNAIDRAPKTHAVVPVWRSWTAPVRAFVYSSEPSSPLQAPKLVHCTTGIVGVSVVGMGPLKEDLESTQTDPYYVGLEKPEDLSRANWIDEILLRTSLSQVDAHYYGDLERARRHQEQGSQQQSISHDLLKVFHIISKIPKSRLTDSDKLLCTNILVSSLKRKLISYSVFDDRPYPPSGWGAEATNGDGDHCNLSEVVNWSVLVTLLRIVLDSDDADLRSALLHSNEQSAWNLLSAQFGSYLRKDRGPKGDLQLQAEDGTFRLSVKYTSDIALPRRGLYSTDARIFSVLSFICDEIVLNSFKYQYRPLGELMKSEPELTIRIAVSLLDENGSYFIKLAFSPADGAVVVEPIEKPRAQGLMSLKYVLDKVDFVSETYKQFNLSPDGIVIPRVLPYYQDTLESPPARVWGIKKVPKEAFTASNAERN